MGRRAIPTPDSGSPSKIDGFFGIASHTFFFRLFLPVFGSKIFFHPEYGLWGLKSKEIARAFTSRNKIEGFFTGNTFLLIFWHFLALFGYFTQFWSVFNETRDLSFFFKVIFNRGVVFSVFRFVCLLSWPQASFLQNSAHFSLSSLLSLSRQTNDKFGNFFFKFSRLHLSTVAKSW